jgi:hypothetical protein
MHIMNNIADFLLSEMLWAVTFDWFHIIINTFVLLLFLKFAIGKGWIRSLLLSFSAHFFAFMVYLAIVVGLIVHMLKWEYLPGNSCTSPTPDPLYASLALALIYAFLQSGFLVLINIRSKQRVWPLVVVTFVSNIISGLLSYGCIIMTMSYLL